jgi:magnesium-transporting ATPase (P-type)
MRNPKLYKIGMEGSCFGKMEMVKWVLYGFWHALVVYFVCYCALAVSNPYNSPKMENGMDLGFRVAGHVVYGVCVFIVNQVLAHKFHHHHWQGTALIIMMVSAFFVIMAIESGCPSVELFAEVSHIFEPMFSQIITWLTIIMACGQVSMLELAWSQYWLKVDLENREIYKQ